MPYVDLAGLSRFAGKSKDFASSACAGLDMANWQKTSAAGAVSFSPVPEMPLDPVVNFLFSETGPASGTKGPDNPSTITGVTQAKVTRCGKNLIPAAVNPYTTQGITFTPQADGGFRISGTTNGTYHAYYDVMYSFVVKDGVQYAVSLSSTSTQSGVTIVGRTRDNSNFFSVPLNDPYTFTGDGTFLQTIRLAVNRTAGAVDLVVYPQLELGSAATSFEPYEGADYAVNLGGTYYGGSVDLSTGVMTVTWEGKQLVYSPTPNYTWRSTADFVSEGVYRYQLSILSNTGVGSCSHLPLGEYSAPLWSGYPRTNSRYLMLLPYATATEANAWIQSEYEAGHPVTVVYELTTPYTVTLTPTQIYSLSQIDPYTPRVNTVYSDQISVQVGYPKSPQATQNGLTSAIVSLGGNV